MPTTLPGISVTEAQRLLQAQDRILRAFPEVERVFGKAGRAETSTDPAPFSMMETTVILKPETEWRPGALVLGLGAGWLATVSAHVWPDRISHEELVDEMDRALQIPGTRTPGRCRSRPASTCSRPASARRSASRSSAPTSHEIERIGEEIESDRQDRPRHPLVFAERVAGGYFVDFDLKRDELARYGLTVDDAEHGHHVGDRRRADHDVDRGARALHRLVRYPRELREDLDQLERVLVPTLSGAQVPLGAARDIQLVQGPAMIRNENGLLAGYVYVDFDTGRRTSAAYVEEAKKAVAERRRSSRRVHARLERPVREHDPRARSG